MDRREVLLDYIEETRRTQKRLAVVFGVLAVVPIGLMFWRVGVGAFVLVVLALVAVCSFWVTEAHNAAHRQKLDELARMEANQGKPLQTAHRRWHK
ncbi:MAG: hypothetical protein HOV81_39000 [Kofleriaceae bacterium]|nr:hypothetical protein [Kofleriaceae bacterium]